MNHGFVPYCPAPRRKALALCISPLFALAAPGLSAAWVVDSCSEGSSGDWGARTGTLRYAAEHADSGETIDLSALSCPDSKISLTTGSIGFAQGSIKLLGPGPSALRIDGTNLSPGFPGDFPIFSHTGSGTLTVSNLGVVAGHVYHVDAAYQSKGGCIYSKGTVDLDHAAISSCSAQTNYNIARGGAVYAAGDVKLTDSTISGSGAAGTPTAFGGGIYSKGKVTLDYSVVSGNSVGSGTYARGGGVYATGDFAATYSTISGNSATGTQVGAAGGGIVADGNVNVTNSTISGNTSEGRFGGLMSSNDNTYAANTFHIGSSTVSGNVAATIAGGLYTNSGTIYVDNSTIAFNSSGAGKLASTYFAPGLAIGALSSDTTIELQSSILSNNTYGSSENDLSVASNAITVSGQNNLVRVAHAVDFFASQSTACPLLGPLRDNGGLTKTHALLSGSAAIDAGNLGVATDYDQRGRALTNGTLDYFRVSGGNLLPDMGAYEVQQDEIVFNAGFDGCP